MTIRFLFAAALAAVLLPRFAAAEISWVGSVSTDVFDEANWDLSGSTVSMIEPNVSIADNLLIGAGPFDFSPIIPELSGQQRLQLDDGFSLTLNGGTLGIEGNDGVGGAPDTMNGPTVFVNSGAQFNPFFVVNDVKVMIDGSSSATFGGGGNPINLSTLDLQPGATVTFLAEDIAAYNAEHLIKTFVNGSPAVEGVNLTIMSDGGAGSIITAVPEPTTLTLTALAGLGLLSTRRRR